MKIGPMLAKATKWGCFWHSAWPQQHIRTVAWARLVTGRVQKEIQLGCVSMCLCPEWQDVSEEKERLQTLYIDACERFSEIGEFVPIIIHASLEHETECPRITNRALGYTQLVYKFYSFQHLAGISELHYNLLQKKKRRKRTCKTYKENDFSKFRWKQREGSAQAEFSVI